MKSIGVVKNTDNAFAGVLAIGIPFVFKLVFSNTYTPVFLPNSFIILHVLQI